MMQPPKSPLPSNELEWRQRLSKEQFHILREKGTEPPHTGQYANHAEPGIYHCAGCQQPLFASTAKFNSGTGWPSFFAPAEATAVATAEDHSRQMVRTEVLCATCQGHLGHVFDDGPAPTGLRYCINSAALVFVAE